MDRINASVHAGMATVVVSVNAGAGGGGLATGEHYLESEKKWELKQFCDRKKTTVLALMLLT